MKRVHAILACTDDYVVGKDDYIPWKMGADLKRFKEITLGNVLLIGFRTFLGIIKHYPQKQVFPGREVYVLADFVRSVRHSVHSLNPGHEEFHADMSRLSESSGVNFDNVKFIDRWKYSGYHMGSFGSPANMILNDIPTKDEQIIYVAGGVSVYSEFLGQCNVVELTVVETKLEGLNSGGAFDYDPLVTLTENLKKALFSNKSQFNRRLVGKISKDAKNEYNASYYQLTRSLDGSTPAQVFQATRA